MQLRIWSLAAAVSLALIAVPVALAAGPLDAAVVSNGVLTLGVTADAGLTVNGSGAGEASVGGGLVDTAAPALSLGQDAAVASVEPFASSAVAATSSVVFSDPTTSGSVRVVHQVHPLADAPNVYEVLVTVENLNDAPVDATYTRPLAWAAVPGEQFQLDLAPVSGHQVEAFRMYFGTGSSLAEATSGFASRGATQLSQSVGERTFAFGYALGVSPAALAALAALAVEPAAVVAAVAAVRQPRPP
jgi:hypothetical protein